MKALGADFEVLELDKLSIPETRGLQQALGKATGARTVPRVFIDGNCIGGGDETVALARKGTLAKLLDAPPATPQERLALVSKRLSLA